ncbi:MAG: RsmB/NOP family class I SAM-dependent RNA methyltransferase [Holosporales bacterium]|nr:RsmB/NOP family class I SAM-dependent RNA methyltransferase [Holosporales bacterium]
MHQASLIQAVIDLIHEVELSTLPADNIIANFFRKRRYIGSSDRKFISETVYAIIRNKLSLQWLLGNDNAVQASVDVRFARLLVIAWLISNNYNEQSIKAIFCSGQYSPECLSDFEISVIPRIKDNLTRAKPENVKHNVPEWLVPELEESFGDSWQDHVDALNKPAKVDLRTNTLKATREQVLFSLAQEGIKADATKYSPWGIRISGNIRLSPHSSVLSEGLAEVQDEGSQLLSLMTQAKPAQTVVDFCAGAGGKALALAAMMENKGSLYALDVSQNKLNEAKKRLSRAGVSNARVLVPDAKWLKRHEGFADVVLVDAPCSGSGTWRRNPDRKWRLTPKELARLINLQVEILNTAKCLVKTGGRLIYATCSVFKSENEAQILRFLNENTDFDLFNAVYNFHPQIKGLIKDGFLRTSPLLNNVDGFCATTLINKGHESFTLSL